MRIEVDVQTGEVKYIEENAPVVPAPAPEPELIDGSAA